MARALARALSYTISQGDGKTVPKMAERTLRRELNASDVAISEQAPYPEPTTRNNRNGEGEIVRTISPPLVSAQVLIRQPWEPDVDDATILEWYMKAKKQNFVVATDGYEALEVFVRTMVPASISSYRPKDEEESSILSRAAQASITPEPRFDVILMDISMPRMDGLEATRRIRNMECANGQSRTTIIALTGLASSSAQHEAFSSGVDLFLTKPVRLKELTAILKPRAEDARQSL